MNFAENLRKRSNEINNERKENNKKNEIIGEIVRKFSDYLNNGKFENFLDKNISKEELVKRYKILHCQFWQHLPNHNDTKFYIAGFEFKNEEAIERNEESNFYKGVELKTIQVRVINNCFDLLYSKLDEMGFDYVGKKYEFYENDNLQADIKIMW